MIKVKIPEFQPFTIEHLVLDYNGTLAIDGVIISGVKKMLATLSTKLDIHVVTADTFGSAGEYLDDIKCKLHILGKENQATAKLEFIKGLGTEKCFCIGNGRNDHLMLKNAGLGIAVIQKEGAASETIADADIICNNISDALELLLFPKRLVASLRS